MKNTDTLEINVLTLDQVTGGTVNKNPNPGTGGFNKVVDEQLNGKNYDAIATLIVNAIQPPPPRDRAVDNSVDIYDIDLDF
jgi:hypothetical protein